MDVEEEDADDPVAGPSTQKVAKIWKYFKKDMTKINASKCNQCDKSLCTPTGTTSTLTRHLKAAHPVQFVSYFKELDDDKEKKSKKASKQPTIDSFGFKKKEIFPPKSSQAKSLTKNIAMMLIENYLPYNLVESTSFRNLLKQAEPRYHVPCRTTFSRSIIPKLYESTKDIIQKEIDNELLGLKCIAMHASK